MIRDRASDFFLARRIATSTGRHHRRAPEVCPPHLPPP
jgi:hypothetical protein